MKFGMKAMNSIADKIFKEELPYIDSIVVGDNSSGKTLVLKLFIEKAREQGKVYFIDAVNRGFDVKKISKTEKKPGYKQTILETRMQEAYFNLMDSFNCFGTLTERVEMIYVLYEKEVQTLFYELTGDTFSIHNIDPLGKVDFGDGYGLLSSGYQAIIRILIELVYYQEMRIEKESLDDSWIIIDELDEFLSPKYAADILEFLKEKFSWAKWLVTTHSCDLVAHTKDANLVILENGNYEVTDINDYSSISEVQILFDRLFGNFVELEPQIEDTLRRLFNNKINHVWEDEDETCLKEIEKQKLTASQQVIVRQIREW